MTAASRDDVERRLERFILDELVDEAYGGGDPLASGAVDSLGIEQLVDYVEEEFGVQIDDVEMVAENFDSVPALAALVAAKQRASRA